MCDVQEQWFGVGGTAKQSRAPEETIEVLKKENSLE